MSGNQKILNKSGKWREAPSNRYVCTYDLKPVGDKKAEIVGNPSTIPMLKALKRSPSNLESKFNQSLCVMCDRAILSNHSNSLANLTSHRNAPPKTWPVSHRTHSLHFLFWRHSHVTLRSPSHRRKFARKSVQSVSPTFITKPNLFYTACNLVGQFFTSSRNNALQHASQFFFLSAKPQQITKIGSENPLGDESLRAAQTANSRLWSIRRTAQACVAVKQTDA